MFNSIYSIKNLYKIEYCSGPINKRMSTLNTGTIGKCECVFSMEFNNEKLAERNIHKTLEKYKYEREFYKCDLNIIIDTINYYKSLEIIEQLREKYNDKNDIL